MHAKERSEAVVVPSIFSDCWEFGRQEVDSRLLHESVDIEEHIGKGNKVL